eukprot:SAG31_NODE_3406_length_4308_cov_2.231884_4_plen_439_part_00
MDTNLTVEVPLSYIHSPYFNMHLYLNKTVPPIVLEPGATSEWQDVGLLIDCLNHGTWNWQAGNYTLTIGTPARPFDKSPRPEIKVLGTFDGRKNDTSVLVSASLRTPSGGAGGAVGGRPVAHVGADFFGILESFEAQGTVPGKPGPALAMTALYGGSFSRTTVGGSGGGCGMKHGRAEACKLPANPAYPARAAKFRDAYCDPDKNPDCLDGVAGAQLGRIVVNMGDEVHITNKGPSTFGGGTANEGFQEFLKTKAVGLESIGCSSYETCNMTTLLNVSDGAPETALRFYLSRVYAHDDGIRSWKNRTDLYRKGRSNTTTGANMSPTSIILDPRDGKTYCHGCYIGVAYQFVRAFREGALSLPWSEDWIFATPVASQQIMTMSLDALRSGMQWHKPDGGGAAADKASTASVVVPGTRAPTPKKHLDMMMYIMHHFPGNM